MRPFVHVASCALILLACGAEDPASRGGARGAPPVPAGGAAVTPLASPPAPSARDLVIRVRLALVTDDVGGTIDVLRAEAEDAGGRVESMRDARADARPGAELALRVPVDALPALRRAARGMGRVESDVESTEDVTGARVDLEARLRNARAAEARLLALTGDRTSSLADVLTAERELARVRESIETMEASARALADDVAMARVAIDVRAPAPEPVASPTLTEDPVGTVASAFGAGIHVARAMVIGGAAFVALLAPPLALLALLGALVHLAWQLVRRLVRRGARPIA